MARQTCIELKPDYLGLCTGFDKNYEPFGDGLQRDLGLKYDPTGAEKWAKLEASAVERVNELLPVLWHPGVRVRGLKSINSETVAGKKELLHGPSRHYRRMIVPALVAEGDGSTIFPSIMHNVYTPLVGEVQALWGVAFQLGLHDVPSPVKIEKKVLCGMYGPPRLVRNHLQRVAAHRRLCSFVCRNAPTLQLKGHDLSRALME
ncbi:hypothetical protein DL769_005301 [Monosporascus sp. CRB-8-3]|nr:hypothetical protein DL769_005301 [Monosporascus sp. CRB-8-3]